MVPCECKIRLAGREAMGGGQGIFCNPTLWLPIVDVGVMSGAGATTLLLRSEWQRQAATRVSSPFLVLDED